MITTNPVLPPMKLQLNGAVLVPDLPMEGLCLVFDNACNLIEGVEYEVTSPIEMLQIVSGYRAEREHVGSVFAGLFVVYKRGKKPNQFPHKVVFKPKPLLEKNEVSFVAEGGYDLASAILTDTQKMQYAYDALFFTEAEYNPVSETFTVAPQHPGEPAGTDGLVIFSDGERIIKYGAKINYPKNIHLEQVPA